MHEEEGDEPSYDADALQNAAQAMAEGGFHQAVLEEELHLMRRRSVEIQSMMGSPAEQIAQEEKGLLVAMFTVGRADLDESRKVGHSSAQSLRSQKVELDRLIDDLKRRIQKLDSDQRSATDKLALSQINAGLWRPERCLMVKQAVLDLSERVNVQATRCAETLGQLWLRTPPCLLYFNVLRCDSAGDGRSNAGSNSKSGRQDKEFFPKLQLDPDVLESWKIFEHIDELAKDAARQDADAVLQLMSLMGSGDVRPEAHEHLVRVVLDTMVAVERHDKTRMERTKRNCPLTANWPKSDSEALNAATYKAVHDASEDWMAEHAEQMPVSSSVSTKPNPVDRMAKLWQHVDDTIADLHRKDPLLRVTPHILELLVQISRRGIVRLREQELIVYGLPGSHRQESHWFTRRQAANKVCELAFAGNMLACDLVLHRLLKDDHWIVRHAVVSEIFRMRGHHDGDAASFRELVDAAEDALKTLPPSCQAGFVPAPAQPARPR